MTPTPSSSSVDNDVRRAIERIHAYGIDGPRPIEEIEAVLQHGDRVGTALRRAVVEADARALAAAIHLVQLLRSSEALDAVAAAAFEHPAPLDAKRQALDAFTTLKRQPPPQVVERLQQAERFLQAPDAEGLERLLELPESWWLPVVDEWLRGARSESVPLAVGSLGRDAGLDLRLLGWLGRQVTEEAAAGVAAYLADAVDREAVKAAKKALHGLRSRGVDVDEKTEAGAERRFTLAIESDPLEEASAWITSVDGHGVRLVWILWPSPSGGNRLLQAVIDDRRGLREVELVSVTRRDFRGYLQRLESSPSLWVDRIEVRGAAGHLAAAAERAAEAGADLPAAWKRWRELVGDRLDDAADEPRARVLEHVESADLLHRRDLRDESMKLLREPAFSTWAITGDVVERAAEEIRKAETSSLMVDDEQRRERVQEAIRKAVGESFGDDGERRLWRRRLEAMGSILWRAGREEEARQALAAAVGLTELRDLFHEHAFARALVHRGIWMAYQDVRRDEQRQGLVRP